MTAFESWKMNRLPNTTRMETAEAAVEVRPLTNLKHVSGRGSSGAGNLVIACDGK